MFQVVLTGGVWHDGACVRYREHAVLVAVVQGATAQQLSFIMYLVLN